MTKKQNTYMSMNKDLKKALDRLGLNEADFPNTLVTGGYSDDCHGLGGKGPGVDWPRLKATTGEEYDAKVVKIDLGDGRCVVFTTTYAHREWQTHLALPDGVTVTATTLKSGDANDWDR